MKLKGFRVKEFRSVVDSGWIDADQITALIGTNESGKTNILLPLWKLNPAVEGEINLTEDLPRDKYHTYRSANPKPVFIFARYSLDDTEQHEMVEFTTHKADEFSEIIVSKDFDGNLFFDFPLEYKIDDTIIEEGKKLLAEYKEKITSSDGGTKAEQDRRQKALDSICSIEQILCSFSKGNASESIIKAHTNLSKFETEIKGSICCAMMAELIERFSYLYKECNKPSLSENEDVCEYIKSRMPKYVYYSNYGNLDSQIYLPQVLDDIGKNNLGVKAAAKARTLRTLFKFVQLNPKEITDLGNERTGLTQDQIEAIANKKKEREILLSSASSEFTKSFNEWWKQGNYTFEFQADGNFFRIWVSDSIRPERIELESRSTGLQWFFSFYLVFLVESELHHRNAILLLDEPGVTLHPLAQKDLFMFFENLAKNNQIMYTTHSPFMVDSNHLERVRSVYVDSQGKTVVSPDLRASERLKGKNQPQSIYPAHAALGLSVSDTLLVNCNPVLVEGESDQLYLSALKNWLISKGKITPLKELVFIPTGGVKGIKATSAILSGVNEIKPPVLLDGDKPGMKMASELKNDFYAANADRIIMVSDYTQVQNGEIEDLFPKEKISRIVTRFLPRPEEVDEEFEDIVEDTSPLCNQIENFAQKHDIELEKGWKVRLAARVKAEILKGTDKVLSETDDEYERILNLFNKLCDSTQ